MVSLILQQIINFLTIGSIYALIALGYTMVYGVLRLINFAHSELFSLGAYVSIVILSVIASATGPLYAVAVIATLLLVFVLVGGVGVLTERLVYKPLREASKLAPMLSALGLSIALQALIQIVAGPRPLAFPPIVNNSSFRIAGIAISPLQIFVFVLSIVLMLALQFLVNRTRLGVEVRAVAESHRTAAILGINVNRTISVIFFLGPGLGALAGLLYGTYYGVITPSMGVIVGLKAFTAAILGGIGSIPGAMLGGFLLAAFEVAGTSALPVVTGGVLGTEYRDVFAFAILILVLLVKPSGLLGERVSGGAGTSKRDL